MSYGSLICAVLLIHLDYGASFSYLHKKRKIYDNLGTYDNLYVYVLCSNPPSYFFCP